LVPVLIVLLVAMACGKDATATPVPAPTATAMEAATATPIVEVQPTAAPAVATSKVERLRFATLAPWIEMVLPWRGGSWGANLVVRVHMEPLIDVHYKSTELVPNLATSWKLENAQEWTFNLRDDVPFHYGWGNFSAQDVPHVIARNSESGLSTDGPDFRKRFGETEEEVLRQVEIVDDYTLKLKPRVPSVDMDLSASSQYGNFLIHSKKQWDEVGLEASQREPAGTSSYKMVDRDVGVWILWERVENHWRHTPEFQEFEMVLVPEHATRLAMLLSEEVGMTELPRELHAEAIAQGNEVHGTVNPETQVYGVWGGCYGEDTPDYDPNNPLSNVKVREALIRAIDLEEINAKIFEGWGRPMHLQAYHPNLPGWSDRWENEFNANYGYDPERSKELLTEAGYPDGFEMKYLLFQFPGFAETTALTEATLNAWREIGVTGTIQEMEYAKYRETMRVPRKSHGTFHWIRSSFTTPMVETRWDNARPPVGSGISCELSVEMQEVWDNAFEANTKEELNSLLTQIGNWKFDNYSEAPMFWMPGQVLADPKVVEEYIWPGNVDAGFDHFEYIKAAK
jgi:ABC-type transport system substrate-binding protein